MSTITLRTKILLGILLLICCSALYSWYHPIETSPKGFTIATQSHKVSKVPKEVVHPKKLEVYKNPEVYHKVDLPEEVKNNPDNKVVSVVDTPKNKTGTTVATTVNLETGKVDTYMKEIPQSLFGFENEKRLGVGVEVSTRGNQSLVLYGDYTFVRVGNVYGSVHGEAILPVNNPTAGEIKGRVQADYRF